MTKNDEQEMLDVIGISSTDELFSDIPKEIRFDRAFNLPEPPSEFELKQELAQTAEQNEHLNKNVSFLGAGVYDHYQPSVVNHIISRSEFYTAYTPYQPEISQGELQAIFEFQSMICELTNMEVANSSLYDGGTALGEAVNLSYGQTKRKKIVVSQSVHPEYIEVIKTYGTGFGLEIVEVPTKNGQTDLEALAAAVDENTASCVVQYPNFYGQIEPLDKINEIVKQYKKTMLITSCNPLALSYLTPPGDFGADIVVGDTQVFGIPAQFGGPHCGYFATTKKLMRKVPGRLVGETVDENGVRGYVLTLQAREQHIRRDKATSNICSNQALFALASSVAMTAFGKKGLHEMAYLNMQKARYMKKILKENGFEVEFSPQLFNEMVIKLNKPIQDVNHQLIQKGIIGGFDLGKVNTSYDNHMLIAVTEKRSKSEMDTFVKELRDINGN